MTCKACGHKHRLWDNDKSEFTHGDTEPFINIIGTFFREYRNSYCTSKVEVGLFACPECKTVIMSSD